MMIDLTDQADFDEISETTNRERGRERGERGGGGERGERGGTEMCPLVKIFATDLSSNSCL